MKALGTGWKRGVRWQDFEVINLPSGKPTLSFYGVAAEIAEQFIRGTGCGSDLAHDNARGVIGNLGSFDGVGSRR